MRSDARKAYGRGRRPIRRQGEGFAGAAGAVLLWAAGASWLIGWTLGWW